MTRGDTRDFIIAASVFALVEDEVALSGSTNITDEGELIFTDAESGRVRKVTVIVE